MGSGYELIREQASHNQTTQEVGEARSGKVNLKAKVDEVESKIFSSSDGIKTMTGYRKNLSGSADVLATDSLNVAVSKLENKIDLKSNSNHEHNYAASNTPGGVANSAVKLNTPVTINGVDFDGSKNITIEDNTKETPANAQAKANKALQDAKTYSDGKLTESRKYTDTKVTDLIGSAPTTLNTLKKLADAIDNNPNFATSITTLIGTKSDKSYVDGQMQNKANIVHEHNSSQITSMSSYSKPTTTSAIATGDSLNVAIGKLERALDSKQSSGNYALSNHDHDTRYLSITGNAVSANRLINTRNIALTGSVTGTVGFNGASDVNITTTLKSPISGAWFNGGAITVSTDGAAKLGKYLDFHNSSASTNNFDTRLQCNGTTRNTVNLPMSSGTLALTTDNVSSATKLQNIRSFRIGSATKTFDGTGDVTITLNEMGVAAVTHTHTSSQISTMNGYVKGTVGGNVLATDSLNVAISKLENRIDSKSSNVRLTRLSNSVTLQSNANTVNMGLAYNSNTDILNVYLSGVRLTPTIDYTATNTAITGTKGITFSTGDVISFEIIKLETI